MTPEPFAAALRGATRAAEWAACERLGRRYGWSLAWRGLCHALRWRGAQPQHLHAPRRAS